ncbi:MAG TPA: cytochrome c oxidase assembly protein [Acidimicrobiia bacterium]
MLADVAFPAWAPHPEVWLLVGAIAAGYAVALKRLGPRLAPTGSAIVTRFQITTFSAGLLAVWVASDWPIHDLGERYFFWVHMVQHTTYAIIAAPLLLMGTPAWLARWLLSPRWLLRTVRYLSRLIPATLIFNFVIIVTHIPVVVDASLHHALLHFGLHALILLSSLIVWMPLLSPLPEVPRLQPLARMLFLFLQSVVPTVPASFLTFGDHPLYKFYETVPRLWGISALDDMRFAGLIMKILVGFSLWITITVVFFRWYNAEETGSPARRVSRDLDRELMELQRQ